jgi:hypothetical protein
MNHDYITLLGRGELTTGNDDEWVDVSQRMMPMMLTA